MKIIIVYGPPGAGKSNYVAKNSRYGDVIIDQDRLYMCLTGLKFREKPAELYGLIEQIRLKIIEIADNYASDHNSCWVIVTSKTLRNYLLNCYRKTQIIEFNTTKSECYRNVSNDLSRKFRLWKPIIDNWFMKNS